MFHIVSSKKIICLNLKEIKNQIQRFIKLRTNEARKQLKVQNNDQRTIISNLLVLVKSVIEK